MNLKIMTDCFPCQILFCKFCIVSFYGSAFVSGFPLLGGMGRVESPQVGVLPLTETYFMLLVDSPDQTLIHPVNKDFQVITQYKLH